MTYKSGMLSGSSGGSSSWASITGKPSTFPPDAHTQAIATITGLQSALDGKQVAGSYAASTHGHVIADVTGLQTALDGKQASGSYAAAAHTHSVADITGLGAAPMGGVATVDFGAVPVTEGAFMVTVAGMTSANVISAFVMAESTADNDAEAHRHAAASFNLCCLPGTGSFTLYATCMMDMCWGSFKIRYSYQ